ncbi:MAG: aspartate dehydrogenase [Rhodospirillaceae bacterium]|nr:aspartate dehydrogenase [Rhodospirillaceae bacterium]
MARDFQKKIRVALIGNGVIAHQIAAFCASQAQDLEIVGALTRSTEKAPAGAYPLTHSLSHLFGWHPDLVIECASHSAVIEYGPSILSSGVDLIIISAGSLSDDTLYDCLMRASRRGGGQLKVAAGALPGIEALVAARLGGLATVKLLTSKPPNAWKGTPADQAFDLLSLKSATTIFSGTAREAAHKYPKNANVAAIAALAGIGFDRTQVALVADPGLTQNTHRLDAAGSFGKMHVVIEANPSPKNPKTSLIAALSLLRLLDQQIASISL